MTSVWNVRAIRAAHGVTAARMHDKVKAAWAVKKKGLEAELQRTAYDDNAGRAKLESTIKFMTETDMAVVVSQSQNELDAFKKKGLDIAPHRLSASQKVAKFIDASR